ncbi:hypothetical protein PAXRUDRAFT_773893 [Paxillus rubicundulus Ve08.2h10]|uniref:Uncharacterized protein n=1 Tax=Paxillus rubicundulus Ve08.2h10 TaxID=930991 RepID=A0A0D0DJL4_9AGAM|nr:hypothetical protein PAXRUDRAFT_773893 [Paxillus rubicundulus Ve08.2h10]
MSSESNASKNSRNSQASIHSLRSRGTVDPTTLKKSRKPSAKWTLDEETAFIDFFYFPSSQQAVMEIRGRPHSMKLPLS